MQRFSDLDRRALLRGLAGAGAAAALAPAGAGAQQGAVLTRPIPSSGEAIPLVGLGSWITFNVGNDPVARDACAEVMRAFFDAGGRMIDSSPMYGSSQDVIGYGLGKLRPAAAFLRRKGVDQRRRARRRTDREVAPAMGRRRVST